MLLVLAGEEAPGHQPALGPNLIGIVDLGIVLRQLEKNGGGFVDPVGLAMEIRSGVQHGGFGAHGGGKPAQRLLRAGMIAGQQLGDLGGLLVVGRQFLGNAQSRIGLMGHHLRPQARLVIGRGQQRPEFGKHIVFGSSIRLRQAPATRRPGLGALTVADGQFSAGHREHARRRLGLAFGEVGEALLSAMSTLEQRALGFTGERLCLRPIRIFFDESDQALIVRLAAGIFQIKPFHELEGNGIARALGHIPGIGKMATASEIDCPARQVLSLARNSMAAKGLIDFRFTVYRRGRPSDTGGQGSGLQDNKYRQCGCGRRREAVSQIHSVIPK